MKKIILTSLTCFSFLYQINCQLITTDPAFPKDNDSVTITFDATQGTAGLKGYTGDVYAHTGVLTDLSTTSGDWKHVKALWTVNLPACKMKRIATDKYQLKIIPSIRSFYGVPNSEKILKVAFVFRSSDGSKEGKDVGAADIFTPVFLSKLNVSFITPSDKFSMVENNQKIPVRVSALLNDSIFLFLDGLKIKSVAGQLLIDTIAAVGANLHTLIAVAKNDTGSVADTVNYMIHGTTQIAALPAGVHDGINYIDDSTVTFVLFAPYKKYIYLIGDFNNWAPENNSLMYEDTGAVLNTVNYSAIINNSGSKGTVSTYKDSARFWITLKGLKPGKEYIFQYLIDGSIRIADPYVEKISDPSNDKYIPASTYPELIVYPTGKTTGIAGVIQTAKIPYNWKVTSFLPPDKNNLVIYELLVRDFTANHNIKTVTDSINYFKRLGINAIELMPFSEFEGNDSWGYNPSFYFAPDKAYGTREDYKKFIDVCHQNGIAVIQDMVLDFSRGTSPLVQMYFENGNPSPQNPWYNVVPPVGAYNFGFDLNHDSPYTRKLTDSITSFWMSEYKTDGFRFDFVKGWTNTAGEGTPYDAPRIINLKLAADHIWKVNPNAYSILELWTDNSEEKVLANYGMMIWGNMNYNYGQAAMGYSGWDLSGMYYKNIGWSKPGLIGYMESHDEERNAYKCETSGNSSGSYNIKTIPTMCQRIELNNLFFLTIPGPKMIWQFGELGYDIRIDSFGRVGDKPIKWEYYNNPDRRNIYNMIRTLNTLKHSEPAFNTISNFSANLTGAIKTITLDSADEKVVIAGNFDITSHNTSLSFAVNGKWYDFFGNDSINVVGNSQSITLNPGEYRMYSTRKLEHNYVATSLNETNIKNQALAFPNPFDKSLQFNIEKEVGFLAMYDIMGHLVLQSPISNGKLINTENIKAGVYFLNIKYKNGDFKAVKVIKL